CIQQLNARPPRLIIAYAQAIYELAQYAEEEQMQVAPQEAILTSAGTLYPFMRDKIESVFQCKVFNRYGSREVGDIACECEEHAGLHVFPWSNYIEIVGEEGDSLPSGMEGDIVVTNLANYAMPLIRYQIGDRGTLSQHENCPCGRSGQVIDRISGRTSDMFVTEDGTLVDANFFSMQVFFRDWISKYQIIQKSPNAIIYRIIRSKNKETPNELDEIIQKTKYIMGSGCSVTFEFVEDLPPSPSGKHLYLLSEVRS
ncbi:MAG: phenylacetate--CoA ligase family protein, partial [Omnitrophica WOR_2 bacterium]